MNPFVKLNFWRRKVKSLPRAFIDLILRPVQIFLVNQSKISSLRKEFPEDFVDVLDSTFMSRTEGFAKAYDISKETGRTEEEAVHLNRLGIIYALMGDKDTAKAKFEEAFRLLPEDHPESIDSKQRLQEL